MGMCRPLGGWSPVRRLGMLYRPPLLGGRSGPGSIRLRPSRPSAGGSMSIRPAFTLLVILAVVLAACGDGGEESDETTATTEAPTTAAPTTEAATTSAAASDNSATEGTAGGGSDVSFDLTLGTVLPLTGDLAAFGPSLTEAAGIAVEEINTALEEQGVSGVTVTLAATEDGQTAQGPGVEAATKLVQSDGVNVIIGAMASNVTIAIAESVAIPNGVVLISPTSTAPGITDLEDDNLVYRILSSDVLQGEALGDAVFNEFGEGATVNVGARNDAFGTALQELFEARFTELGGEVGESLTWNPDAPTFDTEAQQLVSGEPDGWVIIDFPETFARFGPSLVRAGGWDPTLTFMTEAMRNQDSLNEIGADALAGLRGTAPTSEGAPARAPFDELFTERAPDADLTGFEGSSFDATIVAFLAALEAGSSEGSDIADHLQSVTGPPGEQYTFENLGDAVAAILNGEEIDYEGAWGPIDLDENGDPGSAIYEVWEFDGSEITTLETFTFGQD
ncbi:MAG: ABC transporter substrate-binding protein [Acidimicrobiia bacterium]|nr:ABC transporter substrate-binding protein [Acidimicrobiia bacterium]